MKTTINFKKLGRFRRSVLRRSVRRRSVIRRSVLRRSILRRNVLRRNVLRRSVLRRRVSGVTTAPATPAMQGGGTLGGAAYYQTYSFLNEKSFDKVAKCSISRPT